MTILPRGKQYCPNIRHETFKDLCKKRLLKTFLFRIYFDLYEHEVSCLDVIIANPDVYPQYCELQRRDIDVFDAYPTIDNIKSEIQCLRDSIGVELQRWYDEAKQLASYIGTEEEMPTVLRVQCNKSNAPADILFLY